MGNEDSKIPVTRRSLDYKGENFVELQVSMGVSREDAIIKYFETMDQIKNPPPKLFKSLDPRQNEPTVLKRLNQFFSH